MLANDEFPSINPVISTGLGLQKYQNAIDLVYRQTLREVYGTIRRECESVVIVKEYSQTLLEWHKPWFGRMVIEHDGVRTMVERFDLFGRQVGLYTTYELVSWRSE